MRETIERAAELVRRVLDDLWPGRFAPGELHEGALLGARGLGLDSLELLELAVACEDRLGERPWAELVSDPDLRLGQLGTHFATAAGAG